MEKFLYILPDIIILLGAIFFTFLSFIFKNKSPKFANNMLIIVLVLSLLAFIPALSTDFTDISYLNSAIYISPFNMFFKFLIILSAMITGILSYRFIRKYNQKVFLYFSLFLFATLGALIMCMAGDFISLFVSIELLSVSLYFMSAFNNKELNLEASVKYFITGLCASAFMLFAVSLIYGVYGTVNFNEIFNINLNMEQNDPLSPKSLLLNISEIVFFAGLLFKAGAAPFYHWMADVFEGSDLSLGLFISTVVKTGAFCVLIKTVQILGNTGSLLNLALISTAVITLLISNFLALRTLIKAGSIKRFLAYSTIANAGYIFLSISFFLEGTIIAAIFFLITYLVANIGLWCAFMAINLGRSSCDSFECIKGFGYIEPNFTTMLLIFAFSLAGIPFMAGFSAKFYMFYEIFKFGVWAIYPMVLVIIASSLGLYCYIKVAYFMFKRPDFALTRKRRKIFNGANAYCIIISIFTLLIFTMFFASGKLIGFCTFLI